MKKISIILALMCVSFSAFAFPHLSPYSFCAGNPINYVDPDGCRVIALNPDEQQMILNTVPIELQQSINFSENGVLLQSNLMSVQSNSQNFNSLKEIALDLKKTMVVKISSEFEYKDQSGENLIRKMGPIEVDPDFIGNDGGKGVGTSTGETGFLGKTLFPDLNGAQNSPDNMIHVIINSNLSTGGRAQTFSHEAYGHGLIYMKSNGDRKAASHDFRFGNIDANHILFKLINNAINETIINMK